MLKNREIKAFAKKKVKGHRARIIGVTLLLFVCIFAFSLLLSFLFNGIINTENIFVALIIMCSIVGILSPAAVGYIKYIDDLLKGNNPNAGYLFKQYDNFGKIFVVGFLGYLAMICGLLMFVIPGIIAIVVMIGMLYLFAVEPSISVDRAFTKTIAKLQGCKFKGIGILFSYFWVYLIISVLFLIIACVVIVYIRFNLSTNIAELLEDMSFADQIKYARSIISPLIATYWLFILVTLGINIYLQPIILMMCVKFYQEIFARKDIELIENKKLIENKEEKVEEETELNEEVEAKIDDEKKTNKLKKSKKSEEKEIDETDDNKDSEKIDE